MVRPGAVVEALVDDLDRLDDERPLAPNTRAAYRRDLERWGRHLEEAGIAHPGAARPAHVVALLQAMTLPDDGGAASPATRRRMLATIRRVHRARVRWGVDATDPTAGVDAEVVDAATRPVALDTDLPRAEQLDEVVDRITGTDVGSLRDRALLALLVDTGARTSELVAVDLDDVRDDGTALRLGAGASERTLRLGTVAQRCVARWLRDGRPTLAPVDDALLTNLRGRRLTRQGAWQVVRARTRAAGMTALRPRDLRAAFVARLVAEGHDPEEVRARTGDATDHAQRRHRGHD